MLAIDQALSQLEQWDARKCRLIELVYFGGLTSTEAATALGISELTVFRDLKLANAWILERLRSPESWT